jgi:hypothetical protein
VGGQIGPKKVVDDGNLTYFIIRYRMMFKIDIGIGTNSVGFKSHTGAPTQKR